MNKAKEFLKQKRITNFRSQLELIDIDLHRVQVERLLDEYAQQVSIEFGIWVKENQGKENFDFRRGDSDAYFKDWKDNHQNQQ